MQAVKTGKDFTGFYMLRHKKCGTATRVNVGKSYMNGYGPDGKPLLQSVGPIVVTNTHGWNVFTTPCSGCGRQLSIDLGSPIYGSYSVKMMCGSRCTGAVGPACDCSCGGENHGSKFG